MIHGYTEQVLAQLRPRVYAWGPHQVLGDIFLQLVPVTARWLLSSFLICYWPYSRDSSSRSTPST